MTFFLHLNVVIRNAVHEIQALSWTYFIINFSYADHKDSKKDKAGRSMSLTGPGPVKGKVSELKCLCDGHEFVKHRCCTFAQLICCIMYNLLHLHILLCVHNVHTVY